MLDWSQQPTIPANVPATITGCVVGTNSSNEPFTSPPLPACEVRPSPGPSTIAKGEKARGTLKLSLPWRAGGSTYCGRCCAMGPRSMLHLRLDIFIEIPIFVRSLSDTEKESLEAGLRSKDA